MNESGELAVTKFAVEPVSPLQSIPAQVSKVILGLVSPGGRREIWHWFVFLALSKESGLIVCLDEGTLRRSLFEHTGGSYPELITRPDIKIFLPPIGTNIIFLPTHSSDLTN